MQKYIDNYGNEVAADYFSELPVDNNRKDIQIEELWRRLYQVYSALEFSVAIELLRDLLNDIENWMAEDAIKSPKRWGETKSEVKSVREIMDSKYLDNDGNEIEADYGSLPLANNKGDTMYEELWRRIQYIESLIQGRQEKGKLQDILMDIECWLSNDPILSPLRWDLEEHEWQEEQEERIKQRQELDRLIAIGNKSGIANFYRKNGVWYSTKTFIND